MKGIAATIIVASAMLLTTGTAQAQTGVSVDCSSSTVDLSNAQVTDAPVSKTPPGTFVPPPPPAMPEEYYDTPYDAYNESSPKNPRPELYIRAFEQIPEGFGAQEYLAQMRKECTISYGYEELPFSEDFVLAVFDTKGYVDVIVSPTLAIGPRMQPIVAEFTQAIKNGDYYAAVKDFRSTTQRELNQVHVNRTPKKETKGDPCLQEVRSMDFQQAGLLDKTLTVVNHSVWTIIAAALIAGFAAMGVIALIAILAGLRSNGSHDDEIDEDDDEAADNVVDAEVVETEDVEIMTVTDATVIYGPGGLTRVEGMVRGSRFIAVTKPNNEDEESGR